MTEALQNGERQYPKGIYELPGVEPVPVVLDLFGNQVASRIQEIAQETGCFPTIIAPLNGSVLPLHSVCQAWQKAGGNVEDLAHQIQLVNTRKIGEEATCMRLSDGDPGPFALVVEDIIDDGGTGLTIEREFPDTSFELFAPLSKIGKLEAAQSRLQRTRVQTTRTVSNLWIVGGGGLDGGSLKLNGRHDYENVELAVAARLMDRYVYHDDADPLPPYEDQLRAFMAAQVPWIKPSSSIHMWMLRAEWAKMKGKFDVLRDLSSIFPYVLQGAVES